ncbi:MAG: outer membrane beta-barrel protein [Chitinophagaceae bacterium]|nr:outer membrane beta-barrel protein [Chitinophagaceae bacterium]
MTRILLACIALGGTIISFAQTDTSKTNKEDTIKIGGMIIIRKGDKNDSSGDKRVTISNRHRRKLTNVSTNWWIVDLGFADFHDETDYTSAAAQQFAPGSTEDWFDLRTGKSVNVNIWAFMQKLNIVKHYLNLKYGLGVELNNYRFDNEQIRFQKNPTLITMDPSLKDVKKNKLAADYVTVPILLNINFTPRHNHGFGFSGGVSGGYLYSARQKTKDGDDKNKTHDDFNLRKWKLSYIGELNLGPVKLYGSYAFKSMWEKGLDQTPYNFGIRFSHW